MILNLTISYFYGNSDSIAIRYMAYGFMWTERYLILYISWAFIEQVTIPFELYYYFGKLKAKKDAGLGN